MNLMFYLFVPGVNPWNKGGRWVQNLLVLPSGSGASRQSFRERGDIFSACGVFVDD